MTRLCCPHFRLRFSPAAAAYLAACPECGEPLHPFRLQDAVGFRACRLEGIPYSLPEAAAVSLPIPEPD